VERHDAELGDPGVDGARSGRRVRRLLGGHEPADRDGGSFSVNLWDRADTRPFVKFSKPATFKDMALNGRAVRAGVTGAPIFLEAVAYLECVVWRTVECGTHDAFFGEVIDAGFQGETEEPLVARMEDTRMKYGGVKRGGH
jgi:flavin reductase (DIM6/NTAB) family NADH-FMN oxidoreductase RutF